MVWKIRSKTAFTFDKGTQRYITGKFINMPIQNIHEMPAMIVKTDRLAPVRITHNYRNISRACKQFLLGDPFAEQMMISVLRTEFRWPIDEIRSPIYHYRPIYRILGDHTDRHYSLAVCNQHPMQLMFYEYLNKKYRERHAKKLAAAGKGPQTFESAVSLMVEELIEEKLRTMDVDNGEDLTPDDIEAIHHKAMDDVRDKMNVNMRTRNKRGEIEDFLEVRRPFGQTETSYAPKH